MLKQTCNSLPIKSTKWNTEENKRNIVEVTTWEISAEPTNVTMNTYSNEKDWRIRKKITLNHHISASHRFFLFYQYNNCDWIK